ncbi:MAG TPA: NAD-dependent epimerase/dehydratase family protein [Actinomycetes bacterium]|jgi:UDP-glucose 4-epimerase|nr:NAD-dependent epimerase/dehydratase family protein [Actinomycetes bacterium]
MRVLVSGGRGYVGSVVTLRLAESGHQVAVLTHRPNGDASPPLPSGVAALHGDLRDRERMVKVVTEWAPEGVYHLAGAARIRESFAEPLRYFDVNLGGTLNLLHALAEHTKRTGQPARLVFASAGAVYGPVPVEAQPINEDQPPSPDSPYAASKLAAEQLIAAQAATGALGAISLRCLVIAGAVGPYGDPDRSRLIPKALAVAAGQEPALVVNGGGSTVREYTHVADVADAYPLALGHVRTGIHQAINIGSGIGASIREVIEAVEEVTGQQLRLKQQQARPEPQALLLDSTQAKERLSWTPKHRDLRRIVGDAWTWVQSRMSASPALPVGLLPEDADLGP